jgi:hypothetical protein
MPPNKCNSVPTLVAEILAAGQLNDPKCSLTHPGHNRILPQEDLQRAPYVPPNEQRVPKQRVPKQRVMLDDAEPTNYMPPQPLARITNAPPIMSALNPTTRRALRLMKRTHSRKTRNNIPGSVPFITITAPQRHTPLPLPDIPISTAPWCSTCLHPTPLPPHDGLRSDSSQ